MRKIGRSTNQQLREHQLTILAGLLDLAKGEKEILSILNIVMTPSEKAAIAQRTSILYKIHKGSQYSDLELAYGASSSTISKAVDQYLKNGRDSSLIDELFERYQEPKFSYHSASKSPDELLIATKNQLSSYKQLRSNG